MQTQSDVAFRSAVELSELMQGGELSPVELLDTYLARVEELNPRLNAIVLVLAEQARAAARESEERIRRGEARPLEGVPIPIKDNVLVAGTPMSQASRMVPPIDWPMDAELVTRLRNAGAVIFAKTNLPEFGTLPTTENELFGAAHNPWDLDRTPGGSSGGAAAALAAGLAPVVHGNDGGGSLRIPAACCGLFTVKPSRGRVPHGPLDVETLGSLTIDGAIGRTVRDVARVLDVMSGSAAVGEGIVAPPPARPFEEETRQRRTGLRIGWTVTPPIETPVGEEQANAVREMAALCESLGHHVEEAPAAWRDDSLIDLFMQMWAALIGSAMDLISEFGGDPANAEAHNRALHEMGKGISANQLGVVNFKGQSYARTVATAWAGYDAVLTPVMSEAPLRLGEHFAGIADDPLYPLHRAEKWIPFTPAINVLGHPAAAIPAGLDALGMPLSVQAVGRAYDEATLFALAAQIEEARPWAHLRPPVS